MSAPPTNPPPDRRRGARRMLTAGLLTFAVSALLILSPLLWGRWDWNKYFVAFGLCGACLGGTIVLNGGVDWLRGHRR